METEIENDKKSKNFKNYLAVIIFIVMGTISYFVITNFIEPAITNFLDSDKKESVEKNNKKEITLNKTELSEKASKIDNNLDSDSDKINDRMEFIIGTDRYFSDTDNDGFSDYDEFQNGYNPLIVSPNDKFDESVGGLAKEILLTGKNAEFSDLNSLRLKLEEQISNKLCKGASRSDINLNDSEKYKEAVRTKDSCLCSKISDGQGRNDCYAKLGALTNNEMMCNYILDGVSNTQKRKADCFHSLMLVNLDEKYCYRIEEGKNQTGCVLMLSLKTKKYNLCGGIKNLDERDDCYYSVAVFSKNIGLCDKIRATNVGGNDREACRIMIEKSPFPAFR